MPIHFFCQDIDFLLTHQKKTKKWIQRIIKLEKISLLALNYIFCSDDYLSALNKKHLNHTSLTDILTFDHREDIKERSIHGDVFISIERIKENAENFKVSFDHELRRVIIHGLLHLIGFNDKTKKELSQMREKEDACLSLL